MAVPGRRKTSMNFAQIVIALVTIQRSFLEVVAAENENYEARPPPCFRMVMYKRRHYYAPGPSTMPNNRRVGTPSGNLYRKRIAYTELKDMSND